MKSPTNERPYDTAIERAAERAAADERAGKTREYGHVERASSTLLVAAGDPASRQKAIEVALAMKPVGVNHKAEELIDDAAKVADFITNGTVPVAKPAA